MNMKVACFVFLLAGPAWALRGGTKQVDDVPDPVQRDLEFNTAAIFNTPGIPTKPPRTLPPAPVVPQKCTFIPDSFQSSFIVEFEGSPDLLTETDIREIEKYVAESYTDAALPLCDQEHKEIYKATIVDSSAPFDDATPGSRYLQSTNSKKKRFSYRFFVVGTCRSCAKDSLFFDDGIRRKMQQMSHRELQDAYARAGQVRVPTIVGLADSLQRGGTTTYGYSHKRVFDRPDIFNGLSLPPTAPPRSITSPRSCTCTNPNGANMAPTEEGYAANLDLKVKTAALPGIVAVTGVAEVREIDCPVALDVFTAEAIIPGSGDPDTIQTSELDLMGDTFKKTYNSLAFESCDPTFRRIEIATFTIDNTGADAFDGRRLQKKTRPIRFRVAVSGLCKNCQSKSLLFNDAVRRYLSAYESDNKDVVPKFMERPSRQLEYVVNNSTCFCATNAPKEALGAMVFTTAFNSTVNELIETGDLTSVENLGAVADAPALTMAPTRQPTPSPTVMPTTPPTAPPTPVPTPAPTLAPTRTPTTSEPSRVSPTESPRPSPSPSLTPTK